MNLFDYVNKDVKLNSGHRMCAGCPVPIIARAILSATDSNVVVANATGCLEVATTIYPTSAWNVPWIHNTFENAGATISGVETAFRVLKKKGKIKKDMKFVAFGGDGGTYDIGLQSLSGALERGHDFVYVCYDNEGYMNTGGQRSSATPLGANTTTTPVGKVHKGKEIWRKNLGKIAVAHNIPYVAQASISNWADLLRKAEKAFAVKGPAVIVVLSPCIPLWKIPSDSAVRISKLAVETNFWPLYEVENGNYKINYKPSKPLPIMEFIKPQGRFRHLLKPENKYIVDNIQKYINRDWNDLLRLEKMSLEYPNKN
ncbi:MAG: pyruvate ferredoxin oxidoreductase [Nitrospiraceae bacterium]|nr:pyruvate ferredoxin oxidoreductase [Nitrospiraceae bacterium]